jgi:DNA-binding transcriptional ArsR family regulator
MNDDISVNAWQDEDVTNEVEPRAGAGRREEAAAGAPRAGVSPLGVRDVTDAETLKALADPLRLSIVAALMRGGPARPRVLTVKELAAELGEPQTKLYRHVKLLEATGLIRVAASRLVSGILEQRYQAGQSDLRFGPGLMRDDATADETAALATALFDQYRNRFLAASRAGRVRGDGDYPPGESYRKSLMFLAETKVPAARAAAIRDRLQDLAGGLDQPGDEPDDGVPVNVLIAFYSPDDQD